MSFLKKTLLSFSVVTSFAHAVPIDWETASYADISVKYEHKRSKYAEISTIEELAPDVRQTYNEAYNRFSITGTKLAVFPNRHGPRINAKRMGILKKDFESIADFLKTVKPLWKAYYQTILKNHTPFNPAIHKQLIGGCGHIEAMHNDGEGQTSNHQHKDFYTVNDKECMDGSNPDLTVEIQNAAVLKKVIPQNSLETIYLERITTAPLTQDQTYANAMYFLKPGGMLVFDYYMQISNTGQISTIVPFNACVSNLSPFEFRVHPTAPSKLANMDLVDLSQSLKDIEHITYKPTAISFSSFTVLINSYDQLTLDPSTTFAQRTQILEHVSIVLTLLYLEKAGFINVRYEEGPNPFNGRANSRLIYAQKPL